MHRSNMRMIVQIADQKDARGHICCDHAGAVQPDLLASNQHPARRDQDRAGAIQRGIQGGKDAVIGHGYAAGTVLWRLTTINPAKNTTAANTASMRLICWLESNVELFCRAVAITYERTTFNIISANRSGR